MLFVIIAHDAPDSAEKRPLYRAQHLARLEQMEKQSKLFLAGPFTDSSGSLIIIDVDSEQEAKNYIENDPFYLNGVYTGYDIKPFKKVLPEQ